MSAVLAHRASRLTTPERVALVTGAAKNIGLAIASALDAAGFGIVATTFAGSPGWGKDDPVAVTPDEATSLGASRNWDVLSCDLADPDDCRQLMAFIRDRYGRLDCLVNNAGTWVWAGVETSDDDWRHVLEVNVVAPARLVREACSLLAGSPCGRVVNVGSVSGLFSERGQAAYSASKAALHALTRSFAIELASERVTVNAVAPGLMRTSTNAADGETSARSSVVPLGVLGPPEEVGRLVAFLASEQAGYITGAIIPCDGGATAAGVFAGRGDQR
jgi:NAD(P)-dependent dehydrogenase (short-subunit alcohol dehydrogenase family)